MRNSIKQIKAQIAMKDRVLQQQQAKLLLHKKYFHHHRVSHMLMIITAILLPALWLGWKVEGDRWFHKLATQLVEVMTLAFVTYFRVQIMRLLK